MTIPLLLAFADACATRPHSPVGPRRTPSDSPRLLTQRELERLGDMALDDALLRLRPELLRYHGREVTLFIDGHAASSVDLHSVRAEYVARVRLLSPVEAAIEYGPIIGVVPILDVRLRPIGR